MARVNDPYLDDPYFRDALILNRHGAYTNRPRLDRSKSGETVEVVCPDRRSDSHYRGRGLQFL